MQQQAVHPPLEYTHEGLKNNNCLSARAWVVGYTKHKQTLFKLCVIAAHLSCLVNAYVVFAGIIFAYYSVKFSIDPRIWDLISIFSFLVHILLASSIGSTRGHFMHRRKVWKFKGRTSAMLMYHPPIYESAVVSTPTPIHRTEMDKKCVDFPDWLDARPHLNLTIRILTATSSKNNGAYGGQGQKTYETGRVIQKIPLTIKARELAPIYDVPQHKRKGGFVNFKAWTTPLTHT